MAEMAGHEQISQVVVSLSNLLRLSISDQDEFISLAEEIEYVEQYMLISNTRWGERFALTCHLPPPLSRCPVPKLILQPLAENSLIHGFSDSEEGGELLIEAHDRGEDILLVVRDNGDGKDKIGIAFLTGAAFRSSSHRYMFTVFPLSRNALPPINI